MPTSIMTCMWHEGMYNNLQWDSFPILQKDFLINYGNRYPTPNRTPAMDDSTADVFVNRNEPIPVIAVSDNETPSSDAKSKRGRLKESFAGANAKLKDKLQDAGSGSKDYGYSLQDRFFAK